MNKTLMLAIILCCIAADVVGQDTYRPLLTEGKSWVAVTTSTASDFYNLKDYESYIKISGDTVIDGHACKIIVAERKDTGARSKNILLEEDRTIYWYDGSARKFFPLMDFNMHVGDDVYGEWDEEYHGYYYILSEDTVEVNGITYRRLGFGDEGKLSYYWVEGIGSNERYGYISPFISIMGIYTYMKECYENGECIFTKNDFYKEASGVNTMPSVDGVQDDTIYDLQGRRLRHTVPGINIVNGKKILTR